MTLRDRVTQKLPVDGATYDIVSLSAVAAHLGADETILPRTHKILLENMARHHADEQALRAFFTKKTAKKAKKDGVVLLKPARILMQDFTGVPVLVDLAALRDGVARRGGDPEQVNPVIPLDVVIDHSINVDVFARPDAAARNMAREYERNEERYRFLRWGQKAFKNMRLIPPGRGICHQVNLEYLAKVVWVSGDGMAYPDSVLGTDSHTTMVNGLGVLGWGVGGIEAESALLGYALPMALPPVVGCELIGTLPDFVTATDLVLTVTNILRGHGVVGSFVEFYGEGVQSLSLADRATIANMAPEYGATCGFFPIDDATIHYLKMTGRNAHQCALVEKYAKTQGLWHHHDEKIIFDDIVHIDMTQIEPCLAGPIRPHDRVPLADVPASFASMPKPTQSSPQKSMPLKDGAVVLAAITSCTNTSNPRLMIAAGLLARNARRQGLCVPPWVKTSLAPGSRVVSEYLKQAGLMKELEALGFHVVGYGCTSCIGNSGALPHEVAQAIDKHNLCVASVLSGNRNFEGRVHAQVRANYLASPPLVVAYALLGCVDKSLTSASLGKDKNGQDIFLRDLWASEKEIDEILTHHVTSSVFAAQYKDIEQGDDMWNALNAPQGTLYEWREDSTYVRPPPFFEEENESDFSSCVIENARPLAILGDSVTTDHISPASAIPLTGDAADYLRHHKVGEASFNSFGARRGNHEVMLRGTLANIRLRNQMAQGREGGWTMLQPEGTLMTIYEAAQIYKERHVPLVIIAGRDYGSGSSRDWAAKGVRLLGVRAVIAQSFERIHRANLIGMGVLPLAFAQKQIAQSLKLQGDELLSLQWDGGLEPAKTIHLTICDGKGRKQKHELTACFQTLEEVTYYKSGGLLPMVQEKIARASL